MSALTQRIALLSMAVVLVGSPGRALAQETFVADVPFDFTADGTTHRAGRYQFLVMNDGKAIEFETSGRRGEFVGVTHLPQARVGAADGRLVFDEVDGTRSLAELWAPGGGGYLLVGVKDRHAYQTVPLRRPARR